MQKQIRSEFEINEFLPKCAGGASIHLPKDVLESCSLISSTWERAAESSELWTSFCEDQHIPLDSCDRKTLYRDSQPVLEELPAMREDLLKLVNLTTHQAKYVTLKHEILIDRSSACCFVKRNSILSCGGGWTRPNLVMKDKDRLVYEINTITGEVTSRTPMRRKRNFPGILKYRNFVYLFGGFAYYRKQCSVEKYNLQSDRWVVLPKKLLEPSNNFMPFRFQRKVYISTKTMVQAFNLETESFTRLQLKLPVEIYQGLIVVEEETLIIAAADKLLIGNLAEHRIDRRPLPLRRIWPSFESNTPCVWKGGNIYYIGYCPENIHFLNQIDVQGEKCTQLLQF